MFDSVNVITQISPISNSTDFGIMISTITSTKQRLIGEFDRSIIELSKRKLKLIQELNDINESISFYRQQQDNLTKDDR